MWIFVHGFMGLPQSWNRVLAGADLDQPPLLPTLAGHGRDWQSREVESFESEVDRLASLASSAGEPRFLCGYSMGARVALGMLVHHPRLFDAALLIGVHPGLTDASARAERREVDASRACSLREKGLAAFVASWEQLPLFASQRDLSAAEQSNQRDIRCAHDAEGLARALEVLGLAEMPDYRGALASLRMPLELVTGSLDAKFSQIAHALAQESTHIDAEVVEGAGHNVALEAPAAVVAAMQRVEERAGG